MLVATSIVRDIASRVVTRGASGKREMNPNLEVFPAGYHYLARTGRTWTRLFSVENREKTERVHLEEACRVCGISHDENESIAELMRRFVQYMAGQQPIEGAAPDFCTKDDGDPKSWFYYIQLRMVSRRSRR